MIQCFVWYCTRIRESDCTNRPYLMINFQFRCDVGCTVWMSVGICGFSFLWFRHVSPDVFIWSKWNEMKKCLKIIPTHFLSFSTTTVCTQEQLRLKTKKASIWMHKVKSFTCFAWLSCSSHLELFYPDKCLYCRLQGVAQQSQAEAKWLWLSQGFP